MPDSPAPFASLPVLVALVSAFIYTVGALLVKRSSELGVGVWRTAFIANLLTGLFFLPLLLLGGTLHPELWWQPVLVCLCYLVGQWLNYITLDQGDVSVAVPVLGLKILLVALFVTLLGGETLRWQLWAASLLAVAGIGFLNRRAGHPAHHRIGRTIFTAGLTAVAFALFDVLVQRWSPIWGAGVFLPLTLGLGAVLSCGFIPLFRAPLSAIPRTTWPWLLGGTAAIALQSLLFTFSIAQWGHAVSVNVSYSSRGLWSVLLVSWCGHWFKSREQELGRHVLAWRLAGAVLMMSAIVLVVLV